MNTKVTSPKSLCADPGEMQRQHLLQQVRKREVAIIRSIVRGEISPNDVQPSVLLRAKDLAEDSLQSTTKGPLPPPSPRGKDMSERHSTRDVIGPKMVTPIKPRPPPAVTANYDSDGLKVKKGVDRVGALFETEGQHVSSAEHRMNQSFINLEALPIPKPNCVPSDITLEWEDVWPRGASLYAPQEGRRREESEGDIDPLMSISSRAPVETPKAAGFASAHHASFADTLPVLMKRWKEGARRLVHPSTIYLPSYSPDALNIRSQALAALNGSSPSPRGTGEATPASSNGASNPAQLAEPELPKVKQICESLDRALLLTRSGRSKRRKSPKANKKPKRRTSSDIMAGRPSSPSAPPDESDRLMDDINGHFNDLQALTFALHDISAVGFQRGNAVGAATMLCADQMRMSIQRLYKAWRGDESPIVEAKQVTARLRTDIAQLQKDGATQRVRIDELERQLSERTQELTRLQQRSQGGMRQFHASPTASCSSPLTQLASIVETRVAIEQHNKSTAERNQRREEEAGSWASDKDPSLRRERYAFSAKRVEAKVAAMGRELRKRPKATLEVGTSCDDLFFIGFGYKNGKHISPSHASAQKEDQSLFSPRADLDITVSVWDLLGPTLHRMTRIGVRLAVQGTLSVSEYSQSPAGTKLLASNASHATAPDIFQGVVSALETITGRQLSEKLLYQLVRGVGIDNSVSRECQTTPIVGKNKPGPNVTSSSTQPTSTQAIEPLGLQSPAPGVKVTNTLKSSKRDAAALNKALTNTREMATTADVYTVQLPEILYQAPLTFEHVLVSLVPHFDAAIEEGLASVVLRGPSGCEDHSSPFFLFMNQDGMRATVLETLLFVAPDKAIASSRGEGVAESSIGRLLYETLVLQTFCKHGSSSVTLAWLQSFGAAAVRCLTRMSAQRRLWLERSGSQYEHQSFDQSAASPLVNCLINLSSIQYNLGHLWDAEHVAVAHGNERVIDGRPPKKDLAIAGKRSVVSNMSDGSGALTDYEATEDGGRDSVASAHLEARHMSSLSCAGMLPLEPVSSQLLNALFLGWATSGFLPSNMFPDALPLSGTTLAVLVTLLHTTIALLQGSRVEELFRGRLFISPSEALVLLAAVVPPIVLEASAYAKASSEKHSESLFRGLLTSIFDTQLPALLQSVSHVGNNLHWDTFVTKVLLCWDSLLEPLYIAASSSLMVPVAGLRPWRIGPTDPLAEVTHPSARSHAAMALSREATPYRD